MTYDPIGPIDIRVGTDEDREAIVAFALSLAEDPIHSRDRWLRLINQDHIYPLIAVYKQNIVGKVQARVVADIGWLESARVRLDFRRVGIAHSLVDTAMDWLIQQGVKEIRTVVDSDNMAARKIVERHHFTPKFLTINPSAEVKAADANPQNTSEVAPVLDEALYSHYYRKTEVIGGNIMANGQYVPFTQQLFDKLIANRRIYTDYDQNILIILSDHRLPSEYHAFIIADNAVQYKLGGLAVRGFAGREQATLAICHAPPRKEAMMGLAKSEYGWNQPHSLIIYARDSWQERAEKK